MTVYYVDDGGSSTAPYDTWAKAAPTLSALVAGAGTALTTGGNVVYVGSDSVSSGDGATVTFTGPTSGVVSLISATVGTTTYAKSSSNQISGTGTYFWSGNLALYGIQSNTTDTITLSLPTSASAAEALFYTEDCTFKPGSNRGVTLAGQGSGTFGKHRHINLTVSAANDSGAQSANFLTLNYGHFEINGLTFVDSGSHRTGVAIAGGNSFVNCIRVSGADFSPLTGLAGIFKQTDSIGSAEIKNSKTVASPTWTNGSPNAAGSLLVTNSGSANSPTGLYYEDYYGTITSQTAIYRDSGASVESVATSWKLVSSAKAAPSRTLITPWIYGVLASTGSKTFDVFVTQDGGSGDLTDADVWLEVEYMGTSSVPTAALGTDRCSVDGFFSGAAAQDDDTASTWTGSITATYKQRLRVTATVNVAGLYRARVALGKASTTLYVDPLVTVT